MKLVANVQNGWKTDSLENTHISRHKWSTRVISEHAGCESIWQWEYEQITVSSCYMQDAACHACSSRLPLASSLPVPTNGTATDNQFICEVQPVCSDDLNLTCLLFKMDTLFYLMLSPVWYYTVMYCYDTGCCGHLQLCTENSAVL